MKILSISDVITNSSSEVFVIHSKPEYQSIINKEVPEVINTLCKSINLDIDNILYYDIADSSYTDEDWLYNVHKNDLLIKSTDENTIPLWLMEFIESLYYFPKFRDKFSGYFADDLKEEDRKVYDFNDDEYKIVKLPVRSIQREHLG